MNAITRALENLLHNSFRQAKNVRLSVQIFGNDFVVIDVDDDGPGIPIEQREEYLKPFVTSSRMGGGEGKFGLGLSIAHAIAKNHGGRLELADSDMGGARVRLILPKNGVPISA